jgi:RAT1-interacting protein
MLGYKFESLSTLARPWAECSRQEIDGRDEEIVNNNIQYCSIVRTGIGKTSLIIGGEVDCVMGEKPLNPDDPIPWVELKTSREPGTQQRQQQQFERKLCKFWAQSFLLGVPTIVVGFRDDEGFLTRITKLETQKIPGQVARTEGTWNGNLCINMTNQFLELLRETVMGKDGVWRIKRGKNSKVITIERVEETGTGSVISAAFKQHRERLLAVEIAKKLASTSTADG